MKRQTSAPPAVSPFSFAIYASVIKENMMLEDPASAIERIYRENVYQGGERNFSARIVIVLMLLLVIDRFENEEFDYDHEHENDYESGEK